MYAILSLPWAIAGGPRAVELFTTLLSIVNLVLLFRIYERVIDDARARTHAMLFTALLPQFVIYGVIVSTDSLASLMGTLTLLAALRFTSDPDMRNAAWSGLAAGAALLTKGTLIAHAAVLFCVVAWKRNAKMLALFCVIATAVGSYKFIDNQIHFGRPIVHGMDDGPAWMRAQQPTVTSAWSFVDVNLWKLMRNPEADVVNPESVPLLLYASFWHVYDPVSNFRWTAAHATWLARSVYILAVVPTMLLLLGLRAVYRRMPIALAMLALNLAIVMAAGIRYDAWSCFQSRLLFPCFAAIALAFAFGIARVGRWADVCCGFLYAAFASYFVMEATQVVIRALHLR
jgi:hypothetical protein